MSYDVTLFIESERQSSLEDLLEAFNGVTGLNVTSSNGDIYSVSVFGLEFDIMKLPSYLKDDGEMDFSSYSYQILITTRDSLESIIHQVSLKLATELSRMLGGRVMLCLSGVEFLGAKLETGVIKSDYMYRCEDVFCSANWVYKKK